MKKSTIILLSAGAVLLALGIALFAFAPAQNTYLKSAVYLEEPVILPENNGKLVILHGQVETTETAYDATYGLSIEAPLAIRYDEVYTKSFVDNAWQWGWTEQGTDTVMGKAKLGDFELDAEILRRISAKTDYSAFNSREAIWYNLPVADGKTYIVKKGADYYAPTADRSAGDQYEGTVASCYKVLDPAQAGEITLVGVQSGSRLLISDTPEETMHAGVVTQAELVGGMPLWMLILAVISLLGAAACLFLALWKKPVKAA